MQCQDLALRPIHDVGQHTYEPVVLFRDEGGVLERSLEHAETGRTKCIPAREETLDRSPIRRLTWPDPHPSSVTPVRNRLPRLPRRSPSWFTRHGVAAGRAKRNLLGPSTGRNPGWLPPWGNSSRP